MTTHGPLSFALALLLALSITVPAAAQPLATAEPLRAGDIVVYDDFAGGLVRVDPMTGARTSFSRFGDASQGPTIPQPPQPLPPPRDSVTGTGLAIDDEGNVFVGHPHFGTDTRGALLRVDPTTGVRTVVSDFGDPSQGPVIGGEGSATIPGTLIFSFGSLAVEPSGNLLVVRGGTVLLRVDRSTGTRSVVSDFADPAQGPVFSGGGPAVEESGQIVVSGVDANGRLGFFRIDPSSGARALLSDFANPAQGPVPNGLSFKLDSSGDLLVIAPAGTFDFGIFRVDPVTGARTFVRTITCPPSPIFFVHLTGASAIEESGDLAVIVDVGDELFPRAVDRVDASTGACTNFASAPEASSLAVVPTPLVNTMVSASVTSTFLDTAAGSSVAAAGVFRIAATFTNEASVPIRRPFFRVADLTNGNVLVSGDRPPDLIRAGGKGTRQTPDAGGDGALSPGESIQVEFDIGLQARVPFTFFVNVFGEPEPADASR